MRKKRRKSIERKARDRRIKQNIQMLALGTIAVAGVLAVAAVAPALTNIVPKDARQRLAERTKRGLAGLLRKGYVEIVHSKGNKSFVLTAKGRARYVLLQNQNRRLPKKRWDGKWRMVIYDISIKRNATRLRARALLKAFGFLKVQDSIWIYPYDSEELVSLLKTDLRIGKDLLYLIVDMLEYDRKYREHFGLPCDDE